MGQEATCRVRAGRRTAMGRALLETDAVVVRGEIRLVLPLPLIRDVLVEGGWLRLAHADGLLSLELGADAAKWAEKIRNPKSLLDKLGVKPGMTVSVVGGLDEGFLRDLEARAARVARGRAMKASDVIFLAIDSPKDFRRFTTLQASLKPDGAMWAIRPKGRQDVSEAAVMAAGKAAGLVDVKVARFSPTHTAEKFVIPRARR